MTVYIAYVYNIETMTKMCEDIDELEKEKVSIRQRKSKRSGVTTYTHYVFVIVVNEMVKCKRQLGELEERYAELNEPLEYSESKQKQLFEKYMGLQFKLTEDKAISLVFTNINTKDPEQRFVITLDVDEDEQWKGMDHNNVVKMKTIIGHTDYLSSSISTNPLFTHTHTLYSVVHLEPSVHGVQLLINDLNQTSNFGQFCKSIRQKFQQLCSEPTTSS